MDTSAGRADGFGAETLEYALEGFDVADFELDFGFVGHGCYFTASFTNWLIGINPEWKDQLFSPCKHVAVIAEWPAQAALCQKLRMKSSKVRMINYP